MAEKRTRRSKKEIVDYLKRHDTIEAQTIRKITGKSKTTVFRYLQRLVDLDVLVKEGG